MFDRPSEEAERLADPSRLQQPWAERQGRARRRQKRRRRRRRRRMMTRSTPQPGEEGRRRRGRGGKAERLD